MLPDDKTMCHVTGFEKTCFDMVTKCKCRKWVHFLGHDPQTGKDVDVWDCNDHMQHWLLIQVMKAQRETTASIDALRRETAASNEVGMAAALTSLNKTLTNHANEQGLPNLEYRQNHKLIEVSGHE